MDLSSKNNLIIIFTVTCVMVLCVLGGVYVAVSQQNAKAKEKKTVPVPVQEEKKKELAVSSVKTNIEDVYQQMDTLAEETFKEKKASSIQDGYTYVRRHIPAAEEKISAVLDEADTLSDEYNGPFNRQIKYLKKLAIDTGHLLISTPLLNFDFSPLYKRESIMMRAGAICASLGQEEEQETYNESLDFDYEENSQSEKISKQIFYKWLDTAEQYDREIAALADECNKNPSPARAAYLRNEATKINMKVNNAKSQLMMQDYQNLPADAYNALRDLFEAESMRSRYLDEGLSAVQRGQNPSMYYEIGAKAKAKYDQIYNSVK